MIITHIRSVINQDKDFEILNAKANDLHKDFIIKLQKKRYQLSATERKTCILLRLGLNTKEVANILFYFCKNSRNSLLKHKEEIQPCWYNKVI